MLLVLLWLSFLYGSYNGAMVVALTEVVPAEVRTAGFSLAYRLATALFGGFTPLVSTWLIEATGNRAAPALLAGVRRRLRARRDPAGLPRAGDRARRRGDRDVRSPRPTRSMTVSGSSVLTRSTASQKH